MLYLLLIVPSDFGLVKDPPFADPIGLEIRLDSRCSVTEETFRSIGIIRPK